MKKYLNELLNILATMVNLGPIKLEDEGGCALQFDEIEVNFDYIEDTEECLLFSHIMSLPQSNDDKQKLFEEILSDNCLYKGTKGGILGINRELANVLYATRFQLKALPEEKFFLILEDFVNTSEELQEKYKRFLNIKDEVHSDDDKLYHQAFLRI